jgi:hypothetical protein
MSFGQIVFEVIADLLADRWRDRNPLVIAAWGLALAIAIFALCGAVAAVIPDPFR